MMNKKMVYGKQTNYVDQKMDDESSTWSNVNMAVYNMSLELYAANYDNTYR